MRSGATCGYETGDPGSLTLLAGEPSHRASLVNIGFDVAISAAASRPLSSFSFFNPARCKRDMTLSAIKNKRLAKQQSPRQIASLRYRINFAIKTIIEIGITLYTECWFFIYKFFFNFGFFHNYYWHSYANYGINSSAIINV